jgi:hypothetical protein
MYQKKIVRLIFPLFLFLVLLCLSRSIGRTARKRRFIQYALVHSAATGGGGGKRGGDGGGSGTH